MNGNESDFRPFGQCKIIPFPGVYYPATPKKQPLARIILARPGENMPESITDFRPVLQRDGLILLSWDKRLTEKGELYTAYWVTSSGVLRYYASAPVLAEYFPGAVPNHKSYAAEDGVEFYGEINPVYVVHVAPELMMSSPEKAKDRPVHITKLRSMGIGVNFDYVYLLTAERKKAACFRGKEGA